MSERDLPLCIDGRMVGGRGTGVSTYARAVIEAARTIGRPAALLCAQGTSQGALRKWNAAVLAPRQRLRVMQPPDEDMRGRLTGQDIFRRAHVHFTLRRRFMAVIPPIPFGIMHWTYPVPLRMAGWLNIYTVHDLIPLVHPDLSPVRYRRHAAVMREIGQVADRIVTVSEAAKADILSLPGFDAERVDNCGQGVAAEAACADAGFGLPTKGYFLFCGAVEPRKNLERLIAAHELSGTQLPLVIVGPDGWRSRGINQRAARVQNVIRVQYADRPVLLALLRDARALLFPSLAEGFGLPVVEAMQLGTPVLTASQGALAEVAADAALLVDPRDTAALAWGIGRLAMDDRLVADLSKRGLYQAERFSPARFANRLAAVYDHTLAAYGHASEQAGGPASIWSGPQRV